MAAPADFARLLVTCPDSRGIVAAVSGFLAEHGANITDADQHTDVAEDGKAEDGKAGQFFMRVEFETAGLTGSLNDLDAAFEPLAKTYAITHRLRRATSRRVAILVSKQDHCLHDLLYRHRLGELPMEIACVVSNHPDAARLVASYGIAFHELPVTKDNKPQQERVLLDILGDAGVETVVLARYMQVLTPTVIDAFPDNILNIHHSFLPAFSGARPYHQAHEKGVKLI
ncbi:MAG: formyltetrahydrofolate deformylase, partial [Planctomycetota bacterium]